MNDETLNDSLVITKRFRSPNEFSIYIDELVNKFKVSYMDAVIKYCQEKESDIESIGPLINKKLKDKIQLEAEQQHMMKPRGQLPL